MALLTYVCKECGHKQEELVFSSSPTPRCEKCGGEMKQSFSGKCYGSIGGVSASECTHNCATCPGCSSKK
ncbi:MAG: zinc ribbon domain-containing protein [Clostridia bacterium]|nr:zinc ribbon domain-containing protein [Clostridia bacterium]